MFSVLTPLRLSPPRPPAPMMPTLSFSLGATRRLVAAWISLRCHAGRRKPEATAVELWRKRRRVIDDLNMDRNSTRLASRVKHLKSSTPALPSFRAHLDTATVRHRENSLSPRRG